MTAGVVFLVGLAVQLVKMTGGTGLGGTGTVVNGIEGGGLVSIAGGAFVMTFDTA